MCECSRFLLVHNSCTTCFLQYPSLPACQQRSCFYRFSPQKITLLQLWGYTIPMRAHSTRQAGVPMSTLGRPCPTPGWHDSCIHATNPNDINGLGKGVQDLCRVPTAGVPVPVPTSPLTHLPMPSQLLLPLYVARRKALYGSL